MNTGRTSVYLLSHIYHHILGKDAVSSSKVFSTDYLFLLMLRSDSILSQIPSSRQIHSIVDVRNWS